MTRKKQIRGPRAAQPRKAKASPSATPIDGPTPEQAGRVVYERGPVRDENGRTLAMAYHREPVFETMAKKGTIAPDELEALRYYRGAFDRSERSATKSCLNITQGGGMRGMPAELANATASMIDAKRRVQSCEAALGTTLATVRAIALDDRSISDVTIERFGARPQSWIVVDEPVLENGRLVLVDGKPKTRAAHREKIVPRSGRHRAIIADEFRAGIRLLAARLKSRTGMKGTQEIWVQALDDGRAQLKRGLCAPARHFRWWGSADQIDYVRRLAIRINEHSIFFRTAEHARRAMQQANEEAGWQLQQLEPDELAA